MKATHKMVSNKYGTEWELHKDGAQTFFRKITEPTSGGWYNSFRNLEFYEHNTLFSIVKLPIFKGNK